MKQSTSTTNQHGQGLPEYALLIAAIGLAVIGILSLLGIRVSDIYCEVAQGFGYDGSCHDLIFFDDFGSGGDNWYSFYGHDDNWTFNEGDDPNLCHTGDGGDVLLAEGSDGSDYNISADANLSSGNGYGLFFRTTKNDAGRIEGYTFQYDPGYGGGQFIMRKWVNGYELWPPFAAAAPPDNFDWHNVDRQVQVEVEGDTFTAKVDDEEVLTGSDDSYPEGEAGIRTWGSSQACFDDFTVESR